MNLTQFAERLNTLAHELEFGPLPGPQGEERYAAMEEEFETLTANRQLVGQLAHEFITLRSESGALQTPNIAAGD